MQYKYAEVLMAVSLILPLFFLIKNKGVALIKVFLEELNKPAKINILGHIDAKNTIKLMNLRHCLQFSNRIRAKEEKL